MQNQSFKKRINESIKREIELSENLLKDGETEQAFRHLERAHVLGQTITFEHTRVHWLMLKFGWREKNWREIFGQIFRIFGASTKTRFGIYPAGNTGGANVSPFKPLPIPADLQKIIEKAKIVSGTSR